MSFGNTTLGARWYR